MPVPGKWAKDLKSLLWVLEWLTCLLTGQQFQFTVPTMTRKPPNYEKNSVDPIPVSPPRNLAESDQKPLRGEKASLRLDRIPIDKSLFTIHQAWNSTIRDSFLWLNIQSKTTKHTHTPTSRSQQIPHGTYQEGENRQNHGKSIMWITGRCNRWKISQTEENLNILKE